MKVLLDECVPRKLKFAISGHYCQTVPEAGFAGKKNGQLLSLAESAGFELFFTLDKGLQYQQNMAKRSIAVLVVSAKSNRLADLLLVVESCLTAMTSIKPGQVIRVRE